VTVTVTNDSSLTWLWINEFSLQASAANGGTVSNDLANGWYTNGTPIVVSARPASGMQFVLWLGDVPAGSATANPIHLTMDRSRTIVAVFASVVADLLAHYPFTNDAGTVAVDVTPHGYHGKMNDGAAWTGNGILDGAVRIPTLGFVETPTNLSVSLSSGDRCTMALWWKMNTALNASPTLISRRTRDDNDRGFYLGWDVGRSSYYIALQSGRWAKFRAPVQVGQWNHVTVVKSGTSWSIYHNGRWLAPTLTMGWPFSGNATKDVPFSFGRDQIYPATLPFDGWLDDIRIYGRALSSLEVLQLFYAGGQIPLAISGSPHNHGAPIPPYGVLLVKPGCVVTASVDATWQSASGTQQRCVGWLGSGSVPSQGNGNACDFRVETNSVLTWQWTTQYRLTVQSEGSGRTEPASGWFAAGSNVTVRAVPHNGYKFAMWWGDVPAGQEMSNPLTVNMTGPKQLIAVFAGCERDAILRYPFDTDGGLCAVDASGNGYHGVLTNGTVWTATGKDVGGVRIPALGHVVAPANLPNDMGIGGRCSFALWWKPRVASGVPTLLSRRSYDDNHRGFFFGWDGGRSSYYLALQSGHWAKFRTTVRTNTWHHLAIVKNGTNWRIYHNGVPLAVTDSMGWPYSHDAVKEVPLWIGRDPVVALPEYLYDGWMDDIRVYGRALASNEVAEVFRGTERRVQLVVRGHPSNVGTPQPCPYGTNWLTQGASVLETVQPIVNEGNTAMHSCLGWLGTASVPSSGTSNRVAFTAGVDSTLTWLWQPSYRLDICSGGHGWVSGATNGWFTNGTPVALTAHSSNAYHFVEWRGDVPVDQVQDNPLVLTLNRPRSVTAVFAPDRYLVAGEVQYEGPQQGRVFVQAFTNGNFSGSRQETILPRPGRFVIPSLLGGCDYWVRAFLDISGNGIPDPREPLGGYAANPLQELSSDFRGMVIRMQRVAAPQEVVAEGCADAVVLRWLPNTEPGLAGYCVYRFDPEFAVFERLNCAPVDAATYRDSAIVPRVIYFYYVTAIVDSPYMTACQEGPPSSIVSASATGIRLWMPDYHGSSGQTVRLHLNVSDGRGLLGERMALTVSYDPAVLTPLSQIRPSEQTVELTPLTMNLVVSNNSATATGRLDIVTRPRAVTNNATLRILGVNHLAPDGDPVPITVSYSVNEGADWTAIYGGRNLNNGHAHKVDVGPLGSATQCVVLLTDTANLISRRSEPGSVFVRRFSAGDSLAVLPGVFQPQDVPVFLRRYTDADLRVTIGTEDVLYTFEMGAETNGPSANWLDLAVLVDLNEGEGLAGDGRLFDILFVVNDEVSGGMSQTHRILAADLVDQAGNPLPLDISDTSLFTVDSAHVMGDLTGDGSVNAVDCALAIELAAGSRRPTPLELMAGDLDGDGEITAQDVSLIRRLIEGKSLDPSGGKKSDMAQTAWRTSAISPTGYRLSIGSHQAAPGDTVNVPVMISNGDGIANVSFRVNYDAQSLVLTGVRTGTLTSGFDIFSHLGAGYGSVALSRSTPLGAGQGSVAILTFRVDAAAAIGAVHALTLAEVVLGDEYAANASWVAPVEASEGSIAVTLSDSTDSDQDGLSDYQEQFSDGQPGYNPWHPTANPYGTDTDALVPDTDGDTMDDGAERIAGTSALDSQDNLRVTEISVEGSQGSCRVTWRAVPGRVYSIWVCDPPSTRFRRIAGGIVPSGTTEVYVDEDAPTGSARLYAVRVSEQ
jgi:hypothetical protein